MNRRVLPILALLVAAPLGAEDENRSKEGERLHNGIVLPNPWPPRLTSISREPRIPCWARTLSPVKKC